MADFQLKETADAIYSSFLARDFFAKVIPGAVVLMSLGLTANVQNDLSATGLAGVVSTIDWTVIKEASILVWVLVYGVSWALGFTVQSMGNLVGFIRAFPVEEGEEAFRKRMIEFGLANPSADEKLLRER